MDVAGAARIKPDLLAAIADFGDEANWEVSEPGGSNHRAAGCAPAGDDQSQTRTCIGSRGCIKAQPGESLYRRAGGT
jgi:hypothetical protein